MKLNTQLIDELMTNLRHRVVSLTFTKKDGTSREMNCTLSDTLIPSEHTPKGTGRVIEDQEEPTAVRVFDVDVQGWRTVIFDNITNIEVPA
jgi:hypothetical protein